MKEKMKFEIIKSCLTAADIEHYEKLNVGYTVIADKMLKIADGDYCTTYVIFVGQCTKKYMCRDCGEYYEFATPQKNYKIAKRGVKNGN